ncbi:MAG: 2-phosphoglycerate kinase [Acidobacteriota bacterium]|nr:2-phosphoglycerate kinase [Acidobacteriota bacterium]
MTTIYIISSFITIASGILGIYKFRSRIAVFLLGLKFSEKYLGVLRIHRNRKRAFEGFLPHLLSSSKIRTMNLKGYSLVMGADAPDTLLFKLLDEGNREMKFDMLIYFPDSVALQRRKSELGEKYASLDFQKDIEESIRRVDIVKNKFGDRINLRFFNEPEVLWNLVIWDNGMLVGWYESNQSGYKTPFIEIKKNSILWNQFSKYYDNIWKYKSISNEAHSDFKAVFPHSDSYCNLAFKYESNLREYYSRQPDNKNAFIIFIGGGAAAGKSTIAWELARTLGIRNIISTDFVRQIIRQINPDEVLQAETWDLWRFLSDTRSNETLYEGLEAQTKIIEPFIISLTEYALTKGMSTIIEGIHILPKSVLGQTIKKDNHILFFIDAPEDRISKNYSLRKRSTHMRKTTQSFVNVDERIRLHNQIIKNAKQEGETVIEEENWEKLINQALEIVFRHINRK